MATDATGPVTSPDNIPTYNTANDAPSGRGLNAIVAALQTALAARISKPAAPTSGQALIWNGTNWVAQSIGGGVTLINSWTAPGGVYYDTNTVLGGNIPQTYKDLLITVTGRSTDVADQALYCQLNNIATATYQWSGVQANGSATSTTGGAASTDRISCGTIVRSGASASMFNMVINDYAASTLGVQLQSEWSGSTNFGGANAQITGRNSGYLSGTSPITRMLLFPGAGFFLAGTIVKLYGRG